MLAVEGSSNQQQDLPQNLEVVQTCLSPYFFLFIIIAGAPAFL